MKKSHALAAQMENELPGLVKNHDHVHASNCGHKSFVHGNHIDYECEGHYHYTLGDKTYECDGPNVSLTGLPLKPAKVLPFVRKDKTGK